VDIGGNVLIMSGFEWTSTREKAAVALAAGHTQPEVADIAGVADRTIRRWLDNPEFSAEVDRLSIMLGIAAKGHRLRIANRVIRQFVKDNTDVFTTKDLLDWLKYAQGETDGVKLDLVKLIHDYNEGT
jgi:hypothetical protein